MRTSPRGFVTLLVEDDIDGPAFFKTLPEPSAAGSLLGDFSHLRGPGPTRGLTPSQPIARRSLRRIHLLPSRQQRYVQPAVSAHNGWCSRRHRSEEHTSELQ